MTKKNQHSHITAITTLITLVAILSGTIWAVATQPPLQFIPIIPQETMKTTTWPAADQQTDKPFSLGSDGIDISFYQGGIRWDSLANDSVKQPSFIYVRLMGRGAYYDSLYYHNIQQARQHRIPVGTYIFYTHFVPVHEQFRRFISAAHPDMQDLRPMIDVESLSIKPDSDNTHLCDSVLLLSQLMERHYGCRPLIYSSQNFYNRHLNPRLNNHLLWIANYSRQPVVPGALPILWQYSDRGHLPGIYTPVDLDRFINAGSVGHLRMLPKKSVKNSGKS